MLEWFLIYQYENTTFELLKYNKEVIDSSGECSDIFKCILKMTKTQIEAERLAKLLDQREWCIVYKNEYVWKLSESEQKKFPIVAKTLDFNEAVLLYKLHSN